MGIGGTTQAMRSTDNIIIEGPEGQTTTICPFLIPSGFTLWGRDFLSQWGTWLENPPTPQDS